MRTHILRVALLCESRLLLYLLSVCLNLWGNREVEHHHPTDLLEPKGCTLRKHMSVQCVAHRSSAQSYSSSPEVTVSNARTNTAVSQKDASPERAESFSGIFGYCCTHPRIIGWVLNIDGDGGRTPHLSVPRAAPMGGLCRTSPGHRNTAHLQNTTSHDEDKIPPLPLPRTLLA